MSIAAAIMSITAIAVPVVMTMNIMTTAVRADTIMSLMTTGVPAGTITNIMTTAVCAHMIMNTMIKGVRAAAVTTMAMTKRPGRNCLVCCWRWACLQPAWFCPCLRL